MSTPPSNLPDLKAMSRAARMRADEVQAFEEELEDAKNALDAVPADAPPEVLAKARERHQDALNALATAKKNEADALAAAEEAANRPPKAGHTI